MERAVRLAIELGVPIVGRVASSGADVNEGIAALHAWGRVAQAMADASGVVPIILLLVGPAVSGPALLLGLADHVIMTNDAFAYVSGPDVVVSFTGVAIDRDRLGGAGVHERQSGVATMVVADEDEALARGALPARVPPVQPSRGPARRDADDPVDRDCARAAAAVPARATASYDVRTVISDVLDHDSFLELRAAYAPNMVTALGAARRRPVGVIANQPMIQAGSLDIEASQKAARFVQWCDCFNIPVDHLRRHERLPTGPRPRMARHHPPRCRAAARVRRGDGPPSLRRAPQGLRRGLHRDGLRGSAPTGASRGPLRRSR